MNWRKLSYIIGLVIISLVLIFGISWVIWRFALAEKHIYNEVCGMEAGGNTDRLELLLALGAPATCKPTNHSTPLHEAINNSTAVILLLDAGAEVNAKCSNDCTPLDSALNAKTREMEANNNELVEEINKVIRTLKAHGGMTRVEIMKAKEELK